MASESSTAAAAAENFGNFIVFFIVAANQIAEKPESFRHFSHVLTRKEEAGMLPIAGPRTAVWSR